MRTTVSLQALPDTTLRLLAGPVQWASQPA